jgi:capsular polysaccharide biosynthesis protein
MVEIGSLPFADQVATFAAAETVVSVLGSGLSGLLYAPSGVNVLTLAPSRWLDLFFFALMQNRDAHLADIRGPQDPADPRDAAVARFVVERQEIRLGLRALGL